MQTKVLILCVCFSVAYAGPVSLVAEKFLKFSTGGTEKRTAPRNLVVDISDETSVDISNISVNTYNSDGPLFSRRHFVSGNYKVLSNNIEQVFDKQEGNFSVPLEELLNFESLKLALIEAIFSTERPRLSSVKSVTDSIKYIRSDSTASNENNEIRIGSNTNENEAENTSDQNLNEVVDFLLLIAHNDIVEKKKDQISIPNINETFEKKTPVEMKVVLNGTNGWLKSLSSVVRTADAIMDRVGDTLRVRCGLGLQTLAFGYDNYKMTVQASSLSGTMNGSVGSNAIDFQVALSIVGSSCKASLEQLKISKFDKVELNITGLGPFEPLVPDILSLIMKLYKNYIVTTIEQHLREAIDNAFQKFHCVDILKKLLGQLKQHIN